jgi:hypothetical protein
MRGVSLPGISTTQIGNLPDPEAGPGQVLLAMRASTVRQQRPRRPDRHNHDAYAPLAGPLPHRQWRSEWRAPRACITDGWK